MHLFKKARIRIISFIIVVLIVILLVFLVKNGWDFKAAVLDMLSLFGRGGKQ
ncbi:hypothetical protein KY366_00095 [Candidatus Woesearchaeota archaeon]|nr:hypothetical protein [Candidatus Woesearchaeota archaeon]